MARPAPGYIGPYRLLNVVHTGHASLIWQAYDDAQQRIVGVKTLLETDTTDREQVHLPATGVSGRAEDQAPAHHRNLCLALGPAPAVSCHGVVLLART